MNRAIKKNGDIPVVMTQLRTQMKWILWILVFAFLGTIIFSWGMGGFKSSEKPGVIAEINNHQISYEGFENLMRMTYDNAVRQAGGQLDENQTQRLREDTWNQEVERLLKTDEAKRLGLKITDRQIAYIVENFPPNEIQQVESFQRDGKFDIELYREFLRNPQALNYLLDIEKRVEGYLLSQELNYQVIQGTDVSLQDVKNEYIRENAYAKLRFIFLSKDDFEIDSSEITDKMKRHYYQLFAPMRYKDYPKARFAYVKFETIPTDEDSNDVFIEAKAIIEDYRSGMDFAELARQYSHDTGTKDKGGDLDWFDREAMVPEFSEAAFNAEPGQLLSLIHI